MKTIFPPYFHAYFSATPVIWIMLPLLVFIQMGLSAQSTDGNHPALKGKQYKRSEIFAAARADSNGTMGSYLRAIESFSNNRSTRELSGNYKSTQWYSLGPSKTTNPVLAELGLVISIWVDTSDFRTIYAGSNTGGIFRTTDGGENWISLADNVVTTGVLSIQVDPRNKNNIFIGTGHLGFGRSYGRGVMKSTDGGLTWTETGLNSETLVSNFTVKEIALLPESPDTMLALANTEFRMKGYIFRSTDRAETWETVYSDSKSEFFSIRPEPGNPDVLYVTGNRLLKSTDAGLTWADHSASIPLDTNFIISRVEIAQTAGNPNLMLAMVESYDTVNTFPTYRLRLFRSLDNGETFTNINMKYNPFAGYWKMEFEISPANEDEFYLGGVWLFKYRIEADSAKYIFCSDHKYHHDVRDIRIFPGAEKDLLYMGNDGGVSRSETGAESWQDITRNGMNSTQFHNIAISENSDMMYAGPQDGNLSFYNFSTGEWTRNQKIGDAYEAAIDYTNANTLYMVGVPPKESQPHIFLFKSTDGGKFFEYKGIPDSTEVGRNEKPLAMDPVDPQTLYVGVRNVWKTTDGATTWEKISNFQTTNYYKLSAVRVAPSNNKVIAAAYENPNWGDPNPAKLWITPDGGNHWFNITPTGQYNIEYAGIADVTFHPENPQKIWLSLDHEWTDRRVYVTTNGGISWQNYSEGLPSLPINTITFVSGAGYDVLLAATDVGVYYRDEYMNRWEEYGTGLPLTIVSDIKISYKRKKIVVGTFGRGLWEADLCMPLTEGDLVISDTVEWSGKRKVLQDVVVNPGAKLTISAAIEMGLGRKITVMPGAELLIDRGTLTNDCAGMWEGVRLLGNAGYENPDLAQGKVSLLHGGSIEHARTAIQTIGVDSQGQVITGAGGGIIYANNAKFINNAHGIEIKPAKGLNPSTFTLCQFITSKSLPDGSTAGDLVSLSGSNGIRFISCRFENNLPVGALPYYERGNGIRSFNSTFEVGKLSSTDSVPFGLNADALFKQFTYGIKATASSPAFSANISDIRFERNLTGIYLAGLDLSHIANCKFTLNPNFVPDSIQSASTAIYLDHCTNFDISGNIINGPLSALAPKLKSAGMVIHRSGRLNNTIYGNRITNANFALLAQNSNRSPDGNTGIRILYNWFDGNEYDICVTNDSTEENNGIARHQGSTGTYPTVPAGNRFSNSKWHRDADMHNAGEFAYYHFYNEADTLFTKPSSIYRIYPVEGTTPFPSDSAYRPGYMHTTSGQLADSLDFYRDISMQTNLEYMGRKESGNSSMLVNEIEQCTPARAPALAAKLRLLSPWLSPEVLTALINQQENIPNTLISDILSLNPHFTRSRTVLKAIEEMNPPLANYMLASLAQLHDKYSAFEMLEARAGAMRSVSDLLFQRMAADLKKSKQDNAALSPLLALLTRDDRPESHYLAAFLALDLQKYEEAEDILSGIPSTFPQFPRKHHSNHVELFDLNRQLFSGTTIPDSLNEEQTLHLNHLSTLEETAIYATNILDLFNMIDYREPFIFPGTPENILPPVVPPVVFTGAGFQIYPVPAGDYIIFDYFSESEINPKILHIHTISGQLVREITFYQAYGQQLMDVSYLAAGSYVFTLFEGKVKIGEQKVVIAR